MTATTHGSDLGDHPVVVVVRHHDPSVAADVAEACIDGGLRAIEITLTTPRAFSLVERLATRADDEVLVGAGTVLDPDDAHRAIDAGATFLVSPVGDPDVLAVGADRGTTVVPGAFTPTEIGRAARQGARVVKVFPASTLGLDFVRSVTTVLPDIPLLVSGGIADTEVATWRDAGARTVAIGGGFVRAHDHGGRSAVRTMASRLADDHHPATVLPTATGP